jgi:hypothetical protein
MSHFGCTCGHSIHDQTDFLPYKARIRADEDTEKPIELLADTLSQHWEARQHGQEAEFIRQVELSRGETEGYAELIVNHLHGKPSSEVLCHFIYSFWNKYDCTLYECEECGRLWVETERNRFASYLPETDTRHVLWSRHNHNPHGYLDE